MAAALLAGCGGDSDADNERLVNERIAAERAEAARDARQEERIRQLEREARRRRRGAPSQAPAPPAQPAATQASGSSSPVNSGDWTGGSGYTAVLASLASEAAARTLQQEATSRGLDAGVLNSSDFRSLRPGYWVVFSGNFSSQPDAARRAARAKDLGYAEAYPRLVSP